MQFGAGRGVLQRLRLARMDELHGCESGQGGLMKAAQNQLFLSRVVVDIAYGKNARRAG